MLIISIFALIAIFLLNLIFGMYYGFGFRHYWFFELEHFLGGFFVAMFLSNFTNSWTLIFIGLAIITFLWETAEYLTSKSKKLSEYMKNVLHASSTAVNWEDTLLDVILNFIGAIVFLFTIL